LKREKIVYKNGETKDAKSIKKDHTLENFVQKWLTLDPEKKT